MSILLPTIVARCGDWRFNVAALADCLSVSTRALQYDCVELYRVPPRRIIESVRLERALFLLADGRDVRSTAVEAGFTGTKTFCTAFRRRLGISPAAFQKAAHTPGLFAGMVGKLYEKTSLPPTGLLNTVP